MSPESTHTAPGAVEALVPADSASARVPGFTVALAQFAGPFDLLLTLIARKRLDVTELALAEVTDEFLAHMRADWNLGQASEFLVVAATLLALKAHRLLPSTGEEDSEDLELLEARDLLFARLLQYRAFKEAAAALRSMAESASRAHPRRVALEPHLSALLPQLVATVRPVDLARLAAAASRPREDGVQTVHLHETTVPVSEQVALLALRLRQHHCLTFSELVADAQRTAVVVSRFLALLVLYRQASVELEQGSVLGEITVTWCGGADDLTGIATTDMEEEFD